MSVAAIMQQTACEHETATALIAVTIGLAGLSSFIPMMRFGWQRR